MKPTKSLNLFFFGPQGSGKGTQAELLAAKLGMKHFSSGDILRKTSKTDTPLGRYLVRQLASGALTPIPKLLEVFDFWIKKIPRSRGIIFDGFSRQITETRLILSRLEKSGRNPDLVLLIDITRKESIKRLSMRGVCDRCGKIVILKGKLSAGSAHSCGGRLHVRSDDKPAAISRRLAIYHKRINPVLNLFKKTGKLEKINGEQSIAAVHADILKVLKKRNLVRS